MSEIGTINFLIKDMLDMGTDSFTANIMNNHSLRDEDGKSTSWRITIEKINVKDNESS